MKITLYKNVIYAFFGIIFAISLDYIEGSLDRREFPHGFLFGAASSAYQYEGATKLDGRKASIWDTFVKEHPEKILDHGTGDIAVDFYHQFKSDVALMKEIGLESFRFSISWSRILPDGKVSGGVNQKGVDFYNNLINELLSNGIQPFVTLFHWNLPQALEDEYNGFLSPNIMNDFRDYVNVCFKEFGDRVKHWVTFNEPNIFTLHGYGTGLMAPGRCSSYVGNCSTGNSATEPYLVAHHLILCHAVSVKLYKDKYQASQRGIIGLALQTHWMEPKYKTIASKTAAFRALDFAFGWFVDPITNGYYPKVMQEIVGDRLPKFTDEESKMIKGSFDFLGINYYTGRYVDDDMRNVSRLSYTEDIHVNLTAEKNGIPIGEQTGDWIYMYPKGLHKLLIYMKMKYNNPSIYITENGMADENNKSLPIVDSLKDALRIKYYHDHLLSLQQAIKDGVDVKGYYAWSFMDDFEWAYGYTNRYGLVFIDFEHGLTRYFKRSAFWFQKFLLKSKTSQMASL